MNSKTLLADPVRRDYGRPPSIEDFSNRYFVHPLSALVAKAAIRLGVTANQLSVSGLVMGLVAAGFYFLQPNRWAIACGFAAMIAWHIFDGADGRVARQTGTSSAFGRVIDGICDHVVFITVYLSLAASMIAAGAPTTVWFIVVAALASHGLQAAAYEERRQRYQRRLKGIARHQASEQLLQIKGKQSLFAAGYDCIQRLAAGDASRLDAALEQLRINHAPAGVVHLAVNRTVLLVRQWSILNANNRSIMIAAAAFAGFPMAYFLYEVFILNVVLLALLLHEKRVEASILRDISPLLETSN